MSSRHPAHEQPASFAFTPENLDAAKGFIAKYPDGKQASAVMPLLDIAQRQHGWLPRAAMDVIAEMLAMPRIKVYEVANFYTMYNLAPMGKHHIQVCTTTPCWLRGSEDIVHACKKRLGIGLGETTPDGQFTLNEAECLGACVNAPMMSVDDDYFEDLDEASTIRVIDAFARGESPKTGSQTGRRTSEPAGGPTTLTEG